MAGSWNEHINKISDVQNTTIQYCQLKKKNLKKKTLQKLTSKNLVWNFFIILLFFIISSKFWFQQEVRISDVHLMMHSPQLIMLSLGVKNLVLFCDLYWGLILLIVANCPKL